MVVISLGAQKLVQKTVSNVSLSNSEVLLTAFSTNILAPN